MKRWWFGVFLALFGSVYPLLAAMPAEAAITDFTGGGIKGTVWYGDKACQANGTTPSTVNIDGNVFNVNASGAFDTGLALGPGTKSIVVNCYVDGTLHTFTSTTLLSGAAIVVNRGETLDVAELRVAAGNANDTPVDCNAGPAFSWIICGIIKVAVEAIDIIRTNVIIPFLREPPLDKNLPEFQTAYQLWSAFRNVASVFFILVFFMVIIGTAAGFDSYTVKKIMPHLVAGAIIVPFSWYFCAFIIDIGNVLGLGIIPLVDAALQAAGKNGAVQIDLTSSFTALFLGGVGAVGAFSLVSGAATIGMGVVLSVLIALLGVFLTLIFRKIFIILAVVISPFALLAWVLPNTSKWFSEWWKAFFKLVMMYPIIILLFEAGRIFSASAGATYTGTPGGTGDWVIPLFQIMGLVLPLFAVPFAFKFAGKGLAMGSGAIGKMTGGLDKRFGKDSDGAKMAAKNREIKNMVRGKTLEGKGVTALGSAGYKLAGRMAYRRAGTPKPFRSKAQGFGTNPAGLIAHEEAFGAAVGTLAKASTIQAKKDQNLPGETAAARLEAETQAALNQKVEGQAAREGIVKNANELGTSGLGEANRAILAAGAEKKRIDQKQKGANAMGAVQEATDNPLSSYDIERHGMRMGQIQEGENRAALSGENEMLDEMETKVIRDGAAISPQAAHDMRMKILRESAATKAGNRLMGHDVEAHTQVDYSKRAAQGEVDRVKKATGKTISIGEAHQNRMDSYYAAQISRGVNNQLTDEGKDLTYNEVEQAAGGRLSGAEVIAASRANNRQAIAEDRAKLENGSIGDKVTTGKMVDTARYAAAKSFGTKEADVRALSIAQENEAHLSGITITGPTSKRAANLAASQQSYEARSIGQSQSLVKGTNEERAAINVAAADARLSGQVPGSDDALAHAAHVAGESARISKEKQLSEHIGQELSVIDQNNVAPVTPEQYITTTRDETARQLVDKATDVIGAANNLEAEIDTEVTTTGASRAAASAAVRTRHLTNVRDTGLLKGQTNAAAKIQAEAKTADATRTIVGAAAARISPSAPASAAAINAARTEISNTRAAVTGRAAGKKLTEEIQSDIGTQDGHQAQIDQEVTDNLIEEVKGIARGNGEPELTPDEVASRVSSMRPGRDRILRQAATANVESRNRQNAGQTAYLAAREKEVTNSNQAAASPIAHEANIRQATVEAAGNAALSYATSQNKTEDETKVLVEAARQKAADGIDNGTIARTEMEQNALVAAGVAAKDKAVRDAGAIDAQTAALNQAVSDPSRLSADQQLEVDTENAISNLAAKRGQDEALWLETRPGAALNRSFSTAKAAQRRVSQDKVLDDRVIQAKKELITVPRADGAGNPIIDPATGLQAYEETMIENANLSDDALKVMYDDAVASLASGKKDRAIAIGLKLGTVAKGRDFLRKLQKDEFGVSETEVADPSTFNGEGKLIWDKMTATVPFAAAPDLVAPKIAVFKGKKPKDFAAMDWRTQRDYLDYVNDDGSDIDSPFHADPSKAPKNAHAEWHKQAANAVAGSVATKNLEQNLESEQYKVMAQRMFEINPATGERDDPALLTSFGKDVQVADKKAIKIIFDKYTQAKA